MSDDKCYENYPYSFVIGANIIQFAIYAVGAYLIYLLEPLGLILYLAYISILEIRLLKKSCVDCYYYGKRCAFGKGILCSLFFKKGNPKNFVEKQFSFKDLIPDFFVTIAPLVIGAYLLVKEFSGIVLALMIILIVLGFPITGYLRGSLACKYCRQREIGCPAEQIFNKKKTKENK